MDNKRISLFKKRIPIYLGSKMERRMSSFDVRLTTSDKIHNLIMHKAEEEYQKIKRESQEKKRKKFLMKRGLYVEEATLKDTEPGVSVEPDVTSETEIAEPPMNPPASPTTGVPRVVPKKEVARKSIDRTAQPKRQSVTKGIRGRAGAKVAPARRTDQPRPKHETVENLKPKSILKLTEVKKKPEKKRIEKTPSEIKRLDSTTTIFSAERIPPSSINTAWMDEIEKRVEDGTSHEYAQDHKVHRPTKTMRQQLMEIRRQLEEPKPEAKYNPYAHRSKTGVSNCEAIALLTRALLGSTIYKMPLIYSSVDAYCGVLWNLLVLIWISFSIHIYLHARNELCSILKVPYLTLGQTVKQAILLGPSKHKKAADWIPIIINIFFMYHQWIYILKYTIFLAAYAKVTFDGATFAIHSALYIVPVAILCVICMSITSLNVLAKISIVANAACFAALAMLLFKVTGHLDHVGAPIAPRPLPITSFFGETMMELNCIAPFILVEGRMRQPLVMGGLSGIFNISLMFAGLWYMMVGFFSVYQFGSMNDYNYLSKLEYGPFMSLVMYILFASSVIVSFCVQAFRAIEIMGEYWADTRVKRGSYKDVWQTLQRCAYAVLPFIVMYFPRLLISTMLLIGYIIGPFLMLSCPAIVHIFVNWHYRKLVRNRFKMYGGWIMILLSLYIMVAVFIWYVSDSELYHLRVQI